MVAVDDAPRLDDCLDVYGGLIATEFHEAWPSLQRLIAGAGRRYIELLLELDKPRDLSSYLALVAVRQGLQRDWAAFFEDYPLILGPVYTDLPPAPGFDVSGKAEHLAMAAALRLCRATSLIGVPALAIPTGVINGLPQGVQIIAGMYREDLCIEAGETIERSCGLLGPIDPFFNASM